MEQLKKRYFELASTERDYDRHERWRKELQGVDFDTKEMDEIIERQIKEAQQVELNEEERLILLNNIRYKTAEKFVPVVAKVIGKYKGKQAGEKTKQKIRDEIEAEIKGYSVWFSKDTIYIREESTDIEVEMHTHYDSPIIDENNTIQGVGKTYSFEFRDYITEQPTKWIADRKVAIKQIKEEHEKLEKLMHEYNKKYGINGIESLNFGNVHRG